MSRPTFLEPLIGKSAGQIELINAQSGSVLATHVEPAFDSKTRKKGLLGRESIADDYALILAPCSAVHTFSMHFPIDVVFVSRDGTATKTSRSVKPWRVAGSVGAHAVIEAAAGFIDRHEIVPGETLAVREIPLKRRATDAMPATDSATPHDSRAVPVRHTASHHRVTLADIVAGRTPLSWFESVAVVQELCETVLARGPADDPKVPELKHIALAAEGRVTLLRDGPRGHSPVNRTGLILLALTPEDQLPMQLRLVVLEEVSPRPRLKSLAALHRELEFFERPDRMAIVQGVYDRYQQGASVKPPAVVPPPLLEPPPPKQHHYWWRRRGVWAGVAIVLLAVAVASVTWAWRRPEAEWVKDRVMHVSSVASDTGRVVVERIRTELKGARWKMGFRPRPTAPIVPVLAYPANSTAAPSPAISQQGGAPAPPLLPDDFRSLPQASIPPAVPSPARGSQAMPTQGATPGAFRALEVYSAADWPRVAPPTLVSPRTQPNPTGTRGSGQRHPEVDLVVSPAGEVESVRLVSGQTTAVAGMQISAIKTWRFQPATRDGLPVRYRLRLPLPAQ
jgi:uncharacterized protein